jgi:hypothetical protein
MKMLNYTRVVTSGGTGITADTAPSGAPSAGTRKFQVTGASGAQPSGYLAVGYKPSAGSVDVTFNVWQYVTDNNDTNGTWIKVNETALTVKAGCFKYLNLIVPSRSDSVAPWVCVQLLASAVSDGDHDFYVSPVV